ncbi:MAG TPA: site-specific integrase [Gaiellaceae bacterium]|nr:site-specific integrase [Gaiellaceae bacterium]
MYSARFRAYGKRRLVVLDKTTRAEAETELQNIIADVRRGIWRPRERTPVPVEATEEEPTFHVFASEWLEEHRLGLRPRSVEALKWALTYHLLPYFAHHKLSAITRREVDRYRRGKLREREEGLVPRPLSDRCINKTISILAQILDDAIEADLIETNPARGRKRRLRAGKPSRNILELDEVRALLAAAGADRALLATMIYGGLRIGELLALEWRDVDLANRQMHVRHAKTDAGERTVDLTPDLHDDLLAHKATTRFGGPDDLVFPAASGKPNNRSNVRTRILAGAIERANAKLAEEGKPPIQSGVTNHALRRTFASLLYEAGESPPYVMAQMGHTSAALALEVYAKVMQRKRDSGARMDALVRGAELAPSGTNGGNGEVALPVSASAVPPESAD